MKTTIIYWSSTGNTKKMAQYIGEGLLQSKVDVDLKEVSNCSKEDIENSDIVILGCSAMGVEEIDGSEMEPFINTNKEAFKDKSIALFGSYGWGDGEWMETWETMMDTNGARLECDSLMVNEMPEGESADACVAFGKSISQLKL